MKPSRNKIVPIAMRIIARLTDRHNVPHNPLITIEISKSALLHNFKQFQEINARRPITPVIKSNAYGHGMVLVAQTLSEELSPTDAPFFIVDSYFEALTLRRNGIKRPILIIGYTPPERIIDSRIKNTSFVVTSLDALQSLIETASRIKKLRPISIHLKIDTGMHRQGILISETEPAITLLKSKPGMKNIILDGICSHFADADNNDGTFTKQQIAAWNKTATVIREQFPSIRYWHTSATTGHAYESEIDANVSRLGLGLYGIRQGAPVEKRVNLTPVLSMHTVISSVKPLAKDECVGYGCTYRAKNDSLIATIPAGYFEGIDRRLSNVGALTFPFSSQNASIIGRVSMNITTIDITALPETKRGDTVTLISNDPDDLNSVENIAATCKTIPYEILVHIPAHLKRIVVK